MAAGCLIFIGFQKRASIEQSLEKAPPLLILGLIVGSMYLPMSFASESTVAIVTLSSILIASLKSQTAVAKVFTNPNVVYIGLISYSLYLWHWGILVMLRLTLGVDLWTTTLGILATLIVSIISYECIESLPKHKWIHESKKLTFFAGSFASIGTSLFIVATEQGHISILPRNIGKIPAADPWISRIKCHGENVSHLRRPFLYCLKTRDYYRSTKSRRFYWIGGSHAAQMMAMSATALASTDFETAYIRTPTKGDIVDLMSGLEGEWIDTPTGNQIYRQSRSGDILALIVKRDRWGDPRQIQKEILLSRIANVESQILKFFTYMHSKGVRLIIVRDTPEFSRDVSIETCMLQHRYTGKNHCDLAISFDKSSRSLQDRTYDRVIHNLYRQGIKVYSWDPAAFMPTRDKKYSFLLANGRYAVYDYSHLSYDGSRYLGPHFKDFLSDSGILK
jgi:hypothetical protein